MNKKSLKLYERAKKVIPGGVNSPVRAFLSGLGELKYWGMVIRKLKIH